jgi:bifunctional non-homologous end joining protein LigD
MTDQEQHVHLICQGGTSNKEYYLHLVPQDSAWVVNTQWNAIGSTPNFGTKTKTPVPYDKALKIFTKIRDEKLSESPPYVIAGNGADAPRPVVPSELPSVNGEAWLPQLLNPIDEAQAEALIKSREWGLQEKYNGVNRLIGTTDQGEPWAVNKLGKPVPVTEAQAAMLRKLHAEYGRVVFPGEGMGGDKVICHDVLWCDSDLRDLMFIDRHAVLTQVLKRKQGVLTFAPLYTTPDVKRAEFVRLRDGNFEGAVFKRLSALYQPGRPASGGDQLKCKFWAEPAAVIVIRQNNDRASFQAGMLDRVGNTIPVGNVTVPVNQPMPPIKSIVEVKYLYVVALPPRGNLYQPVYLGPKDGGCFEDCYIDQLKVKAV